MINEDAAYSKNKANFRTQLCFAIKPGINGLLDVARKTYLETSEGTLRLRTLDLRVTDIQRLALELREQHGMSGLRLQYTAKRGYFLSSPLNSPPAPNIFLQVHPLQ